jgi:glycosyltransferase involved in cell wall biosynthesis
VIVAFNALSVRPDVYDGAATFSLNVLPELAAALPDDEVVALVRDGETRLAPAGGLRLESLRLPRSAAARVAYEAAGLGRTLRRLQADVLVAPSESLPLRLPCPTVVVAQNLVYHCGGPAESGLAARAQAAYYRGSMPRAYRRAARVAAVSETTARVLSERAGLDLAKTAVVHEGSDSRLLPPPEGGKPRGPRLLVVSTLAPYKGLERTLDLFAALRRARPELELDLVGAERGGFRSVLAARAAALGVAGAVRFLDAVGPAELADRYERSLALLMLSECESFGLPLVEAMRYGLPVVSSGCSSLREVAASAALELGPDAVSDLLGLLDDPAAREELAARGRRRAAELTWRATGRRLAAVVREACR